jgi:beta-galactosidase
MPLDIQFPAILHGGDYNPEQWPVSVWDDDVRLMQEAYVNVATLPVFGWVTLQPDEDTFTFDWLDRIVDKLWAGGVHLCMATATGSAPAWVDQKYPDILRVDEHGRKLQHGGRHSFCPNSPNFRRLSTTLAGKIAQRYGKHPGLVVWHVGNEYSPTCWCEQCAAEFRVWLQNRYGTLDQLNSVWYTRFWGHTYTDWSQIEPPTDGGEQSIQPQRIDYNRFASQSLLNCYIAERDAIRKHSPNIPITTNLMGACHSVDYHKWAAEMDLISFDSYPHRGATPSDIAFSHSLMRGAKEGQPWMLMEQTPSQQNWQPYNALKRPGIMRLWSFQAIAHGSDAVMYFQWRRGRGGCEKFHGAVVEHSGRSDARVFQEVASLGKELHALGKRTLDGRVDAKVAVLFDWEVWWGVEYAVGPSKDLRYVEQVRAYYYALHDLGITADIVNPGADLSKYALVVAPVLYMVKPGIAEKLEQLVSSGATLLTTYFSGIVDENDLVFENGYPGPLAKLLGLRVEETDVLSPSESNQSVFSERFGELKGSYNCGLLCERVHLEGAKALAHYGADFYMGEPTLTVNQFGKGKAYYAATMFEPNAIGLLLEKLCDDAGIAPPLGKQPGGVEVMSRIGTNGESLTYVLNHNTEPARVTLPAGTYQDLLSGKQMSGNLDLPKYGVAILAMS